MENSSNKLITVYEIKPEVDEDGNGLGGRDVLVEIVSSPGNTHSMYSVVKKVSPQIAFNQFCYSTFIT